MPPGTRLRIETELNIGDVLHSVDDEFEATLPQGLRRFVVVSVRYSIATQKA